MAIITAANYEDIVQQATSAAAAYYDGSTELMTDAKWDALVVELDVYEAANGIAPEHSLHDGVAAGASAGGDIEHTVPMLSLDKIKDDGLDAFLAANAGQEIIVEPKLDGLAVTIHYSGGKLISVAKRGDGFTGEDVTAIALTAISNLPTVVSIETDFEVRGEVYLGNAGLEKANQHRREVAKSKYFGRMSRAHLEPVAADAAKAMQEAEFKNARNGASGVMAKEDSTYAGTLSFAAYDTTLPAETHSEAMIAASQLGFTTAFDLIYSQGEHTLAMIDAMRTGVKETIEALHTVRPSLPFAIDGAVIKINSATRREELGTTSRAPRWAAAFKYPPLTGQSIVREVELTIGKTGRLGLRARIDPVHVDGSTIEYASLHNVGWLEEQDIRINDTVVVMKRGDVIPRVESPVFDLRPEDSIPWAAPESCPKCGGEFDKSTKLWRCIDIECSIGGRLRYAVSRDAGLDIEGLGGSIIDALIEEEKLTRVSDLFTLTEDTLAEAVTGVNKRGTVLAVGQVTAAKIMAEIEKAKDAAFNRVITSLSIRMTGRTMGRRLASAFPHVDLLLAATPTELATVEGIAGVKAEHIYAGLQANRAVLMDMAAAGVNMGSPVDTSVDSGPKALAGKTVVISGAIPGMSRGEAQEVVECLGGKSSGSVSKNTNILVAGPGAGSKVAKASVLGVEVISPEQFLEIIR